MGHRELPQPGPLVACLWMRDPCPAARSHRILPDACVQRVLAAGAGPAGERSVSFRTPAQAAARIAA